MVTNNILFKKNKYYKLSISTRKPFSISANLLMEQDDSYLSDSNSEVTVVSNETIGSDTSNAQQKLDETKNRINHYIEESKVTRKDLKNITVDYDKYLKAARSLLIPDNKASYDSIQEVQDGIIREKKDDLYKKSGSGLNRRINTNVTAGQICKEEAEFYEVRKNFLEEKLGHYLPNKAALDSTAQAHTNLSRDALTLSGNLDKLQSKSTMLSKIIGKLPKQETGGESSVGVKRNREVSLEQGVNTTKQQKTTADSSLLDDYANVSSEMPDYFGFDD